MSSRNSLLKRRPREVDIDGDKIFVRSMTLAEAIEVDRMSESKSGSVPQYIVQRCVVEPNGERVFPDGDDAVLEMPIETISLISDAVKKISSPGSVKPTAKN